MKRRSSSLHDYGPWEYGPVVDRKRARAFFSGLRSVKLSWYPPTADIVGCPVLLDIAHRKLRRVTIQTKIEDHDVLKFLNHCSPALSVVRLFAHTLSPSTLELFAMKCTGLRALDIREGVEPEGVESLMRVRGSQLVALQLGNDYGCDWLLLPEVLEPVVNYCPSLEYLSISIFLLWRQAASIEEDVFTLVQKCGPTLRLLCIELNDSFTDSSVGSQHENDYEIEKRKRDRIFPTSTLIRTIAAACPLLRELELQVNLVTDLSDADLPKAVEELLEKCGQLRALHLLEIPPPVSDAGRAKFRSLDPRCWVHRKKYFDWTRYPIPTLDDYSPRTSPT